MSAARGSTACVPVTVDARPIPFGSDLWTLEGPPVRLFGVPLPTRAVIVRLRDGTLWVNSPVPASEGAFRVIDALGVVSHLVAPTRLHAWRLALWHARYPTAARWLCGREADVRAAEADPLEGTLPWQDDLTHVLFAGNVLVREVEFFHERSSTLLIADFVQSYPAKQGDALGNTVKCLGGVLDGGTPRDIRFTFWNRRAARAAVHTLLSWDFDNLVVAHGACVRGHAKAFVADAFRWLEP